MNQTPSRSAKDLQAQIKLLAAALELAPHTLSKTDTISVKTVLTHVKTKLLHKEIAALLDAHQEGSPA